MGRLSAVPIVTGHRGGRGFVAEPAASAAAPATAAAAPTSPSLRRAPLTRPQARSRASGGAPPSRATDNHQRFARFAAQLRALFEGLPRAHAGGLRLLGGGVRL